MAIEEKIWKNLLSIDERINQILAKENSFSELFDESFLKSIQTNPRNIILLDRILNAPHDLCMNFIDRKFKESTQTEKDEPLFFSYDQRGNTIVYVIETKEGHNPVHKGMFNDDWSAYVEYYIMRQRSFAGIIEFTELTNKSGHYFITSSPDYEPKIKRVVDQLLAMLVQIPEESTPQEETINPQIENIDPFQKKYQDLVLEYVNQIGRKNVSDFLTDYNARGGPYITAQQFQRVILPGAEKRGWIRKSHPETNSGRWIENL